MTDALRSGAAGAVSNVAGGIAKNVYDGKPITVGSVAKDAAIGAAAGVGGHLAGKAIGAVASRLSQGAAAVEAEAGAGTRAIKSSGEGASSAKNNANLGRLNKQLASESQLSEKGQVIAGGTHKAPLRKAAQLAQEHGGDAADYVKMRSSSYTPTSPTGEAQTSFEIHWEQNTVTGERFNVKTIVNPNQKP